MVAIFERVVPMVRSSFLDDSVHSDFSAHASHIAVGPSFWRRHSKSFVAETPKDAGPLKPVKQLKPSQQLVNFVVIFTMILFNGCCFTAVVPSVPFYLQILEAPATFLGWVVSFYSLGQIFGSPIAGWLLSINDWTSRRLLTVSSTLGLLSSSLYAVAPGYFFVLLSRLLTGISAGMEFTTELTFIAENTSIQERTTYLASVTACNVVGFIMGPALGSLFATLDIHLLGGLVTIDQYTGPGWLLVIMFVLDLSMVRCLFTEPPRTECDTSHNGSEPSERAGLIGNGKAQSDASYGGLSSSHESTENGSSIKEPAPSLPLVLSLIFVQFTVMYGFSLLETITSPLVQDEFDWNVQDSNLLFTCGGLVSLVAYVTFVVASKWVEDRWLVLYALVLCFIGFVLAIDWQQLDWVPTWVAGLLPPYLKRFLAGFFVMNAGFMTGRPVTFAIYSKLISPKYQAKYLCWMVAGGSAARTLGPFAAVSLYYGVQAEEGDNLLALFGSVGLLHLACVALVLCQWPKLLPSNDLEDIR